MAEPQQSCPTCEQVLPGSQFYVNCAECKGCKKKRSQRNRAIQARKIAAFERFTDLLFVLVDQASDAPAEHRVKAVA